VCWECKNRLRIRVFRIALRKSSCRLGYTVNAIRNHGLCGSKGKFLKVCMKGGRGVYLSPVANNVSIP
jgi:hypothetical protein